MTNIKTSKENEMQNSEKWQGGKNVAGRQHFLAPGPAQRSKTLLLLQARFRLRLLFSYLTYFLFH